MANGDQVKTAEAKVTAAVKEVETAAESEAEVVAKQAINPTTPYIGQMVMFNLPDKTHQPAFVVGVNVNDGTPNLQILTNSGAGLAFRTRVKQGFGPGCWSLPGEVSPAAE